MDLVIERDQSLTTPCQIDGVGDVDVLVVAKCVTVLQVALFAVGVVQDCTVRVGVGPWFQQCLLAVRRDTQAYLTVARAIKKIAIVVAIRYEPQRCALVRDCG